MLGAVRTVTYGSDSFRHNEWDKATAHFLIKVANKSSIPKIHLKLLQMPNIIVLVRLIGNFDLSAMAVLILRT